MGREPDASAYREGHVLLKVDTGSAFAWHGSSHALRFL